MLPQYSFRDDAKKQHTHSQSASPRDILLPLMLDTLELDIRRMRGQLKMADAYIQRLRAIQDHVTAEIAKTRQEMRRLGIKPHEQHRDAKGLTMGYTCRGYNQKIGMLWDLVRAELEVMLAGYLGVELDGEA